MRSNQLIRSSEKGSITPSFLLANGRVLAEHAERQMSSADFLVLRLEWKLILPQVDTHFRDPIAMFADVNCIAVSRLGGWGQIAGVEAADSF